MEDATTEEEQQKTAYDAQNGQQPGTIHPNNAPPPTTADRALYNLRNKTNITTPATRTEALRNSFLPSVTKLWNDLPQEIKEEDSTDGFKSALRSHTSQTLEVAPWFYAGRPGP